MELSQFLGPLRRGGWYCRSAAARRDRAGCVRVLCFLAGDRDGTISWDSGDVLCACRRGRLLFDGKCHDDDVRPGAYPDRKWQYG